MSISGYFRLKKHKAYVFKRVIELRRYIFEAALMERRIDDLNIELFLKYNNRLKKLEKYSL